MRDSVIDRHPKISCLPGANVANARKGEMCSCHPEITCRGHFEYPKALLRRGAWNCVKCTFERGIRKLERAHQDEIAHHNKRLSLTFGPIGRMAGGVPRCCQRSDTGCQLDIFLDGLKFSGLDVWREQIGPERNPLLSPSRGVGRMEKEVDLRCWRPQSRWGMRDHFRASGPRRDPAPSA